MNLKSILSIGAIAGLVAVSFACTSTSDSSGGGSTSSGVTIGGTLSGLSLMSHDKLTTFAVTDYSVKCVTFANPPIAGNGDLGADSTFSLTLDGAATTDAFGCFVLKASAVVATMVFKDSTADSMDGGKSQAPSYAGGGASLNLGAIVLDEDTGEAVVDTATITGDDASAITGSWADITGTWALTCITDTTAGYACNDEPPSLYLHQFEATDAASTVHKGLAVWESNSDYTGCGSSEDLDASIPGTWSSAAALNTNFSFDNLSLSAIKVDWVDGSGKTVCGFAATANTTTCDQISANTANWQSSNSTSYDADDCQAMCAANGVHNISGTCPRQWNVDHSKTAGLTSAGDLVCGVSGCGIGSAANFVVASDKPEKRYLMNELVIQGNIGSVFDSETRTESICVGQDGNGCTNVQCTFTRYTKLSIKQVTATSAVLEVSFHGAIDSASPAACSTVDSNNWVLEEIRESKLLFTAIKQ